MSNRPDNIKPQFKLFAEQYLITQNATQSAVNAGYAKKGAHVQGCRLLKMPKVRAYLDSLRAPVMDAAISSTKNILIALEENIRRCMQQVPVTDKLGKQLFINKDGEMVPVLVNVDTQGANKAIELIGKHLGSFDPDRKEKEDKPHWVGLSFDFSHDSLTPAEHDNLLEFRKQNEIKATA